MYIFKHSCIYLPYSSVKINKPIIMPKLDTPIFKGMKKTICITPADDESEVLVTAISILNQFKVLGFNTRRSFIQTIADFKPEYHDYDNIEKLRGFWQSRVRDKFLNDDLQIILDKLKTS